MQKSAAAWRVNTKHLPAPVQQRRSMEQKCSKYPCQGRSSGSNCLNTLSEAIKKGINASELMQTQSPATCMEVGVITADRADHGDQA